MRRLKNKKNLCAIFLIYFSIINISNAQNDEISDISEYNNSSYLTTNLLSSINPIIPRWRIGYIRNINDRWKIGLDIGYGNHNLTFYDLGDNYELWEIRPEFYYFIKTKRRTKKYLSVEPFYIHHKDIFFDGTYFPENGESLSYDKANYKRQKYGLNFKYGFLFNSKKRIGFNLYTGLGLRFRKNSFTNTVNPEEVDLGPEGGDMFGFDDYRRVEGNNIGGNFVLGLKIYYRLNN
jgi:hypothetical protein